MNFLMNFAIAVLFAAQALANEEGQHGGEHAAHHGPDMMVVFQQAFNVAIVLGILIYFLRQPIKDFFANQRTQYLDIAEKTLAAKKAAEHDFDKIKAELVRIETNASENLSRAEAEAADLRNQMIKEAEEIAKRIQIDAQNSARLEADKAVARLRDELLIEGLALAKKQLSSDVSANDHQRLNDEFIRNVEAVNP